MNKNTQRLIKKYPNRRLYDTHSSSYVTLADIKALVLECENFAVVDAKSNDDDIVFGKVVIDKSSLNIISGSVVDFKKEMIGESFVIDNPKATASWGCGLSFSV